MATKIIILSLLTFFVLIYFGSMHRSPKVLFNLTENELKYHKSRVLKCNDQNSIRRLAGYYEYVVKDESATQYWRNKFGNEKKKCPIVKSELSGISAGQ